MDQWSAAGFQAEGLAEKGGSVLWYLTLLCGFWVLFSTQLGSVDGVPRTYTDLIWTGLKRARNLGEHNAKWIYYPILGVYILWGVYRDVFRQAVLYDSGIRNNWRVSIGDYLATYALRQPEILTEGDTAAYLETGWVGVVCGVLFNLRDYYSLSKSACALYFPDFWIDRASGLQTPPTMNDKPQ